MDLILQLDNSRLCERNLHACEPLLLLRLRRPTAAPFSAATVGR